jgi:hypothetical protein
MSYGDCFSPGEPPVTMAPADWPPIPVYRLEAGKSKSQITNDPRPWKGSKCGRPDIQELRRNLLVKMAGLDPASVALKVVVLRDLPHESDDQYRRDAVQILQEQAQSFAGIVAKLQSLGLITASQAAGRHLHMQVFVVPFGSGPPLPELPDLRLLGIIGEYRKG